MVYQLRRILVMASLFLLVTLLAACGKKGPLYMPDHGPKASVAIPTPTPAQPPAASPP